MSKIQKAWLGFFLALFILPEALWSPVGNFIYELSQTSRSGGTHPFRTTLLENPDNVNTLSTILFIQFLGFFLPAVYLIILRKQIQRKALLWFFSTVLILLSGVVFLFFWGSISLRNIGF